jgi:hypothetical protein
MAIKKNSSNSAPKAQKRSIFQKVVAAPVPIAKPVEVQKADEQTFEKPLGARQIEPTSTFMQEKPGEHSMNDETKVFRINEKEKLITTLTAGGVVLSFGLSIGSVIIVPAWPAGAGLLATLGVISCMGAFMARESI